MLMVAAYWRTHRSSRLAWFEVGGHQALSLHSSNELGKLSQWPRNNDSIINIVIGIIIIN